MKNKLVIANTVMVSPFLYLLLCVLLETIMGNIGFKGFAMEGPLQMLVSLPLILVYYFFPF
jgi:hypothetical protein